MNVIVVGGVPGAGKSTAITRVTRTDASVVALDPDQQRAWLRSRLPDGTPYRLYRPVVHAAHLLRTLWHLVHGPVDGRTLVVHDPATRPRRRRLVAWLAQARGWQASLLLVDVDCASARIGQYERGRVVNASSFGAHWRRWLELREQLAEGPVAAGVGRWSSVTMVDRRHATSMLRRMCLAHGDVAECRAGSVPDRAPLDAVAAQALERSR